MIEMRGTWVGVYAYDRKWMHSGETSFQIVIESEQNSEFHGTVQDDVESGGDPLPGIIRGRRIAEAYIEFSKEMPRQRFVQSGCEDLMGGKPYKIFYAGELEPDGTFAGIWRIKGGLTWINRKLNLALSSSGTWSMKKQTSH